MNGAQRVDKRWKFRARQPGGVLPLRQAGKFPKRSLDCAPDLVHRQALGQRILRLDQRQLRELGLVDDAIGVHHLQVPVVEGSGAGHDATRADRQKRRQVVATGIEERKNDVAGVVAGIDQIRRAKAPGRRRAVAIDGYRHRDHSARHDVSELGLRAAVDRAARQGKDEVDRARGLLTPEQTAIQALFRSDAGERGDRAEQRVENGWPHRFSVCVFRSSRAAPTSAMTPDIGAHNRYINGARLVRAFGVGVAPILRLKMTGMARSSDGLDERRRRLLYRCWHRGTRETDLIMGPFADAWIGSLSELELTDFERLSDVPDPEIYAWVTGEMAVPPAYDTPLFRRLCAFHNNGR